MEKGGKIESDGRKKSEKQQEKTETRENGHQVTAAKLKKKQRKEIEELGFGQTEKIENIQNFRRQVPHQGHSSFEEFNRFKLKRFTQQLFRAPKVTTCLSSSACTPPL